MTPTQAVWGNGYHTGVRDTLLLIGLLVVVLGIFYLATRKKQTSDMQPPPTIGYQPLLMQY